MLYQLDRCVYYIASVVLKFCTSKVILSIEQSLSLLFLFQLLRNETAPSGLGGGNGSAFFK